MHRPHAEEQVHLKGGTMNTAVIYEVIPNRVNGTAYDSNVKRTCDISDAELWLTKATMMGGQLETNAIGRYAGVWMCMMAGTSPTNEPVRAVADWPGAVAKLYVGEYLRITTE